MSLRFLRVFYGDENYPRYYPGAKQFAPSYARFPHDQLQKVLDILKQHEYSYNDRIGKQEMDGQIYFLKNAGFLNRYATIRRKNGEPYWNITDLVFRDCAQFTDQMYSELFKILTTNGVDLVLPQKDWEYIPPITKEEAAKYTLEKAGPWTNTDSFTILQAQEVELEWYNKEVEKQKNEEKKNDFVVEDLNDISIQCV
jgi:hypothetical protein